MLKQVTIQDLELLYHIETTCFPIQEAASYQSLKERLTVYHEGFEIFYIDHQAIGYIGGLRKCFFTSRKWKISNDFFSLYFT